jgi:hypothetical protein
MLRKSAMAHHPDDIIMARMLIVLYGQSAREDAARRSGLATRAKRPHDVLRWSLVIDAIAALEAGDIE